MKTYTVEEMQTEIDKVEKEVEDKYKEALKLIYNKDTDISIRVENKFIIPSSIRTEGEEVLSPKEVLDTYKKFIKDTKEHKNKAQFKIKLWAEVMYEDKAIFFWEATFLDVVSGIRKEQLIKVIKQKRIGKLIKPEEVEFVRLVECKAIEMFLSGELTYKGLVKSTYTDCEL